MKLSLKSLIDPALAIIFFSHSGSCMDDCQDLGWKRQREPLLILVENNSSSPLIFKAKKTAVSVREGDAPQEYVLKIHPKGHPGSVQIFNCGEANGMIFDYLYQKDEGKGAWSMGFVLRRNTRINHHLGLLPVKAHLGSTLGSTFLFNYSEVNSIPFYQNNLVRTLYLVFKAINDVKDKNKFNSTLNRDTWIKILEALCLTSVRSIEDFPGVPVASKFLDPSNSLLRN
jgi:hypothetical protein